MESKEQHQGSPSSDQGLALEDGVVNLSHCLDMQDIHVKDTQDGPNDEEMSVETLIKGIGEDLRGTCLQWLQPMTENEKIEKLSPSQVDELLEAARALESHLQQEKQKLLKRLQVLSQTLQLNP